MTRRGIVFLSFLAAFPAVPLSAHAQETGSVVGRVMSATGPLPNTRIQVIGTALGSLTDAEGNYRIAAVPTGTQQIRALRLGFAAAVQTVNVAANTTATANFTLSETATTLDEVIVTATGEEQRRR